MVRAGQSAICVKTASIATRGDGSSCGQHQTTPGQLRRSHAATTLALVEEGDERKPCR
jgi:hypothetical protein